MAADMKTDTTIAEIRITGFFVYIAVIAYILIVGSYAWIEKKTKSCFT